MHIAPGYHFGDKKLLYSRIGYSTAESVDTLFTNSADDGTKLFDRRVHGFLVGVGYRQPVIEKVYGFVEGNYTVYEAKLENTTLPASGALVANAGALGTTPSVSLGLGRTCELVYGPSKFVFGEPLAQLVEHRPFKARVFGSSPKRLTIFNLKALPLGGGKWYLG